MPDIRILRRDGSLLVTMVPEASDIVRYGSIGAWSVVVA
jgi:hypothetical protein